MKTFNPNIYFSTGEVQQALAKNILDKLTTREKAIKQAQLELILIHGESANYSFADICDKLHSNKKHLCK